MRGSPAGSANPADRPGQAPPARQRGTPGPSGSTQVLAEWSHEHPERDLIPSRGLTDGPAFESLTTEECWRLLGSRSVGRLCFCVDSRVQVVLTAYDSRPQVLYFRAAAFGAVARQVRSRPVTLQLDDQQGNQQADWVVTATGTARLLDDASTLASLWTPVRPAPVAVGQDPLWFALTPDDVRGRRRRY